MKTLCAESLPVFASLCSMKITWYEPLQIFVNICEKQNACDKHLPVFPILVGRHLHLPKLYQY